MVEKTERISSGIASFDPLVSGGFPKGSVTLLSGTPGTGKSIFCAQTLYFNALKGKKCLLLDLEQNEGMLESQMKQFGWDSGKVDGKLTIVSVESSNPNLTEYIIDQISKSKYDLIALDSLDSIANSPMASEEGIQKLSMAQISETVVPTMLDLPTISRLKLKKIFNAISKSKATAFLTSEIIKGTEFFSRDSISEFLSDGIVVLKLDHSSKKKRQLTIEKMRSTKHSLEEHAFEIAKKGIVVGK